MCAALIDAQTGLRTDELRAELFAFQITFGRVIGGREEPDTDKGDGNGEQRRVLIREDRLLVAKDRHPNRWAEDHQHYRRQQAQPAANHGATSGQS